MRKVETKEEFLSILLGELSFKVNEVGPELVARELYYLPEGEYKPGELREVLVLGNYVIHNDAFGEEIARTHIPDFDFDLFFPPVEEVH